MAFYCCTCAVPCPAPSLEKPAGAGSGSPMPSPPRQLPCCDRIVCGSCLTTNPRFATYCPYCQIATAPPPPPLRPSISSDHTFEKAVNASPSSSSSSSSYYSSANRQPSQNLLPPGLKPPPPYRPRTGPPPPPPTTATNADDDTAPPPPYSIHRPATAHEDGSGKLTANKDKTAAAASFPLLHYLDHDRDTVASLCLRYGVSADALRRANRLTSDHLLLARRVIQIPAREDRSSSSPRPLPISLSPYPVEGAAEVRRKAAIRRFMVACKVADYDLAVLYLEQTATTATGAAGDDGDDDGGPHYDLSAAMAAYTADEAWERAHPLAAAMSKTNKAATATAKHAGAQRQRTLGGGLFAHAAARVWRQQQQQQQQQRLPPHDGAVS